MACLPWQSAAHCTQNNQWAAVGGLTLRGALVFSRRAMPRGSVHPLALALQLTVPRPLTAADVGVADHSQHCKCNMYFADLRGPARSTSSTPCGTRSGSSPCPRCSMHADRDTRVPLRQQYEVTKKTAFVSSRPWLGVCNRVPGLHTVLMGGDRQMPRFLHTPISTWLCASGHECKNVLRTPDAQSPRLCATGVFKGTRRLVAVFL